MPGKTLMVQGTMSSVGKSLMVAALCRIFKQDGLRVAPFKAQNMALNSFVTYDGREIGRAQAMQAAAAEVDVTAEMNPILIKPEADSFSQIVVMGKPWARLAAGEYMRRRNELWAIVTGALDSLRAQYDLVIMEGAGSPAELNMQRSELVNMAIAEHADAPVILIGNIECGGVFAQLLGTLMLLEAHHRARVRGLIVNKFRGDRRLFDEGVQILEQRGGVPVLGVVPFIRDLQVAEEDSMALDDPGWARGYGRSATAQATNPDAPAPLDIAVIRLPHISNFDDFDPLRLEADVKVRFVDRVENLAQPDLIIVPGTKTTIADLLWMRERQLAARIVQLVGAGTAAIGVCGGYQMFGTTIHDPQGAESDIPEVAGLGLLPIATTFAVEKATVRAAGRVAANQGLFAGALDLEVTGYEIHMGRSTVVEEISPLLRVTARGTQTAAGSDGAVAADGWIAGTYFHGLFDNDLLRATILRNLAARKGIVRSEHPTAFNREAAYDQLAMAMRPYINMAVLHQIIASP